MGKSNEVDRAEVVKVCCRIEKMLQMLHIYVILTKKQLYYNIYNRKVKTVPCTNSMSLKGHTTSNANCKTAVLL